MFHETRRIDESFDEVVTTFESRDEYLKELRVDPHPLPATHAWEYRYEDPTSSELAKNRMLLPKKIRGPRALTLAEIAAKTKDFETLGLGELRWLADRHDVKLKALKKGEPKQDDVTALRDALRAFMKDAPPPAPVKSVRANTPPSTSSTALPADIAGMDDASLLTLAGTIGVHEEYEKIKGGPIAQRRAWLANKRAELEVGVT